MKSLIQNHTKNI